MSLPRQITQFDALIQAAHDQTLPFDWRLLKAQLIAESSLNPNAQSPAGALGIAQFMPPTFREVALALDFPLTASPYDPHYAIPACAWYMARQIKKWTAQRPEIDRYCLALASYNAGFGNVLNAQKLANGSRAYAQTIAALPRITGPDNARQTSDYVRRILAEWQAMIVGG